MPEQAPVVVIGAGRSGTNLVRDIICAFEGFGTWPCDEINYVWRHGNRDAPTDELLPDDARPEVVRFIRRAFDMQRRRQGGGVVVEKTCANSLRVGFVDRVVPDALYVYIVRDGRDVVASAMQRWTAKLDVPYLARKARFVPVRDLPHYALRYLGTRVHRLRSDEKRLGSWGPRFAGMDELLRTATLAEVCAHQWRRCVDLADEQLGRFDPTRVHRVRYEELVAGPDRESARIAAFVGGVIATDLPAISTARVGRWHQVLSEHELTAIKPILHGGVGRRGT